jgi:hypothetical protein
MWFSLGMFRIYTVVGMCTSIQQVVALYHIHTHIYMYILTVAICIYILVYMQGMYLNKISMYVSYIVLHPTDSCRKSLRK